MTKCLCRPDHHNPVLAFPKQSWMHTIVKEVCVCSSTTISLHWSWGNQACYSIKSRLCTKQDPSRDDLTSLKWKNLRETPVAFQVSSHDGAQPHYYFRSWIGKSPQAHFTSGKSCRKPSQKSGDYKSKGETRPHFLTTNDWLSSSGQKYWDKLKIIVFITFK